MRAELLATRAVALACGGSAADAERLASEALDLSRAVEIPVLAGVARCIQASEAGDPAAEVLAADLARVARETRYVDGLIAGYRGYPELGRLIAADTGHRRWLRDLMTTARDDDLLRVVGLGALGGADVSLSPREAEVFHLMRQGHSNREIAAVLFISEATVKVHAHHIYDKLGVRSRTEAVLKAPITT
jgi:DNA-binding CsgD family transcriptional regulator